MALLPTFQNLATLKSIRENSLNPTIDKVNTLDNQYTNLVTKTDASLKGATLDTVTKKIKFVQQDGAEVDVDLSPIIVDGTFPGMSISTSAGQTFTKIKNITFGDEVTVDSTAGSEIATVSYDWKAIVPKHQDYLMYQDLTTGNIGALKQIVFTGEGEKATVNAGVLSVNIPKPTPFVFTAEIPGQPSRPITEIQFTGYGGATQLVGDKLQITVPTPTPPSPAMTRYFEGFYDSKDDMEAKVKDPVEGRSYAFAKITVTGKEYYLPYMYVNSLWRLVEKQPEVTYTALPGGGSVAVTSVKPNSAISISPTGELDLDKFALPVPQDRWFMGIYDTEIEIKALKGIPDRSYALLRNASANNGYLPYAFRRETGATGEDAAWRLTPSFGHLMWVEGSGTAPDKYRPIYGIRGPNLKVNNKGVLDIPDTTMRYTVKGVGTTPEASGDVIHVTFERGASNVKLDTTEKTATILHPQLVVDKFDSAWVSSHRGRDYVGNIYYDKSTGRWMGMMDTKLVAGDEKWTPIAHRYMSDQVLSLDTRYPKEHKPTTGAAAETGKLWEVSGTTYLEKDDDNLPDAIKSVCGAFIKTEVKASASVTPPVKPDIKKQVRIQTCYADDGSGKVFMRAYDIDNANWKTWISAAGSSGDLETHNKDPNAHTLSHKAYKVFALTGKLKSIFSQQEGGSSGGLKAKNGFLLADNFGDSPESQNYVSLPYAGAYRINGVLAFSGYDDNKKDYPTGRWQILIRARHSNTSSYQAVGQFTYTHSDGKAKYPNMSFIVDKYDFDKNHELIFNLTFEGSSSLGTNHPNVYLAPVRTFITVEDVNTYAGTRIGASFRNLFAHVDPYGNVGIKVHHTSPESTSGNVRLYGETLDKDVQHMAKVS